MKLIHMVIAAVLVLSSVTALEIISPISQEYEAGDILIQITHDVPANLSFELGNLSDSCENCTELNATIAFTEGNFTLNAESQVGNDTQQANVSFSVIALDPLELSIHTPSTGEVEKLVMLNASTNMEADSISYVVDDANATVACENCSEFIIELNLTEGNHTIFVSAVLGNESVETSVDVVVLPEQADELELTVHDPEEQQYTGEVPLNVSTNVNADISFKIDNGNSTLGCENCTEFTDSLDLDVGNHTVTIKATVDNESVSVGVDVEVVEEPEDPDDTDEEEDGDENEEGEPRFTGGLNKLPQQVAAGQLSDTELADIIRSNQLNPGILNRLIKTGALGDASIDAIIETQSAPPGIFMKILGFFGFKVKTVKDNIFEEYNLTNKQKTNLLSDDDLSEDVAEEVKNQLNRTKPRPQKRSPIIVVFEEDEDVSSTAGLPPGLAKKNRTPPGLLKKFNAGKKNK